MLRSCFLIGRIRREASALALETSRQPRATRAKSAHPNPSAGCVFCHSHGAVHRGPGGSGLIGRHGDMWGVGGEEGEVGHALTRTTTPVSANLPTYWELASCRVSP